MLRKIAKAAINIGDKVGIHASRVGSVTFGDKKVRTSNLGRRWILSSCPPPSSPHPLVGVWDPVIYLGRR